jgi:membrane protein implicated in regulation of membrane protease activity
VILHREHVGCGLSNPFASKLLVWAASFGAGIMSAVLVLATGSWWYELVWLALPAVLGPMLWWEFVHKPSKMYVTWWP